VLIVRLVTALHGLLFFGIDKPKARHGNARLEEHQQEAFKVLGSLYPLALYTVVAYRLLLTLGFGSGVEAAALFSDAPLGSIVCFVIALPLSMFAYFAIALET
jgi:hypothetical protein